MNDFTKVTNIKIVYNDGLFKNPAVTTILPNNDLNNIIIVVQEQDNKDFNNENN